MSEENFKENLCITMLKHFQTFFFETSVLKMFWLGYVKLKEISLKTKTKSKADHCALLPIKTCIVDISKTWERKREIYLVFCENLDNVTQKQMDSMFYIMIAKKID